MVLYRHSVCMALLPGIENNVPCIRILMSAQRKLDDLKVYSIQPVDKEATVPISV